MIKVFIKSDYCSTYVGWLENEVFKIKTGPCGDRRQVLNEIDNSMEAIDEKNIGLFEREFIVIHI